MDSVTNKSNMSECTLGIAVFHVNEKVRLELSVWDSLENQCVILKNVSADLTLKIFAL